MVNKKTLFPVTFFGTLLLLTVSCAPEDQINAPEVVSQMQEASVPAVSPDTAVVTADAGLKVRKSPGIDGEYLWSLQYGDQVYIREVDPQEVTIGGITGHWTLISPMENPKDQGWVFGAWLEKNRDMTGKWRKVQEPMLVKTHGRTIPTMGFLNEVYHFAPDGTYGQWRESSGFGLQGTWKQDGDQIVVFFQGSSDSEDMMAAEGEEEQGEPYVKETMELRFTVVRAGGHWRHLQQDDEPSGVFELETYDEETERHLQDVTIETISWLNGLSPVQKYQQGMTVLMWLSYKGLAEEIPNWLAQGSQLQEVNTFGQSPLHLGVLSGSLKTVQILLNAGADPRVQDKWGQSPLDLTDFNPEWKETSQIRALLSQK